MARSISIETYSTVEQFKYVPDKILVPIRIDKTQQIFSNRTEVAMRFRV